MSSENLPEKRTWQDLDMSQPADLAAVFVESGYWQKDTRDRPQAMVKILAGRELNLGAFASMQGIDIVEGHLRLRSVILASMVKRSCKYDYRVRVWTDTGCKIEFLERDSIDAGWESLGFGEFNDKDRERAGLSLKTRKGYDSVWCKHPRAMYFARALSQGVNAHCPDVNHGIRVYTEGDFPDEVSRPAPVHDATKTDDLNAALEEEPKLTMDEKFKDAENDPAKLADAMEEGMFEPEVIDVETEEIPEDISEQDIPGLT